MDCAYIAHENTPKHHYQESQPSLLDTFTFPSFGERMSIMKSWPYKAIGSKSEKHMKPPEGEGKEEEEQEIMKLASSSSSSLEITIKSTQLPLLVLKKVQNIQ